MTGSKLRCHAMAGWWLIVFALFCAPLCHAAGPYVLCIGDSTLTGFGASPSFDPCAQLATLLGTFTGNTYTSLNHGQDGTTSADWLQGGTNYNAAAADITSVGASNIAYTIVILQNNDAQAANQWSAATYVSNMENLLSGLIGQGIGKIILNQGSYIGTTASPWNASSNTFLLSYLAQWPTLQAFSPSHVFLGNQTWYYTSQANQNLYFNNNDFIHPSGVNNDGVTGNPGWHQVAALWAQAIEGLFMLPTGPWAGVLDPLRATDWSPAGVTGSTPNDPPSSSWTKCGATITSGASAATIAGAVLHTGTGYTGCGSNTYVLLDGTVGSPATFNLSAGILMQGIANSELRGGGRKATKLVFTGASTGGHGLGTGLVMFDATDSTFGGGSPTAVNWTAGYSKGTTTITLANLSSIVAKSGIATGSILVGDECDDNYTGTPCTGTSIDNGAFVDIQDAYNPTGQASGTMNCANNSGGGSTCTHATGTAFSAITNQVILINSIAYSIVPGTITATTLITYASTGPLTGATFSVSTGASFNATVNAGRPHRGQQEYFEAVSCSPPCGTNSAGTVTITPALHNLNWNSGQSPQVWLIQPSRNFGLRDLTIDATSVAYSGDTWCVESYNGAYWWIFNVAILSCPNTAMYGFQTAHADWHSNYIYNSGQSSLTNDNSAMNFYGSNNFVGNTICQNCHLPEILNGPVAGNVTEAIFCTNVFTGNSDQFPAIWTSHSNGAAYNLWDHINCPSMIGDQAHGESEMVTCYRCFLSSWDSAANVGGGPKTDNITSVANLSFDRYWNILDSVLGTPGVTTTGYEFINANWYMSGAGYIYDIGSGNNATPGGGFAGGPVPIDPVVKPSTLRANNWDAFNGSCQNNASEIPNTIPNWPNPTPTGTWPASFFLTTRPNWWPASQAFPAVGCDVSSGNVGQIGGTINTVGKQSGLPGIIGQTYAGNTVSAAWGSHVNAIPAEACFLALGGLPDGTNAALNFDQSDCPSSAASGGPTLNGAFKATGTWN